MDWLHIALAVMVVILSGIVGVAGYCAYRVADALTGTFR